MTPSFRSLPPIKDSGTKVAQDVARLKRVLDADHVTMNQSPYVLGSSIVQMDSRSSTEAIATLRQDMRSAKLQHEITSLLYLANHRFYFITSFFFTSTAGVLAFATATGWFSEYVRNILVLVVGGSALISVFIQG